MNIEPIPALSDNYIYLLVNDGEAAVVDPADAEPVQAALKGLGLDLKTILITHNHFDHVAGVGELVTATGCEVIGPVDAVLSGKDRAVSGGDSVTIAGVIFEVLDTPGHTAGHICYHAPVEGVLFSGDILFAGGCGRVMASPPVALWQSLLKLRALPDNTRVYCGHEYTQSNLEFAVSLEPGNTVLAGRLEEVKRTRAQGKPSVPSSLGVEKQTNPFLRADTEDLRVAVGMPGADGAEVFAEIRKRKDRW